MFTLLATSAKGRLGRLETAHGVIETPVFFPVATAGAMRGLTMDHLRELGAEVLLCNTYHLHLRPGEATVRAAGGLHEFIGWDRPILTDSGGFQVFSLKEIRKLSDEGAHFQSHLDGSDLFLGPVEATRIQHELGADIIMCFDECPPSTAPRDQIVAAVDRTLKWAKECKREHEELKAKTGRTPLLFGIVQGGLERDLRQKCAEELVAIDFDGYAIGGLAVGESQQEMYDVLECVCPLLPEDKPRYLMGVGHREQLPVCIAKGIDLFDCVMPMREARHGKIYVSDGSTLRIKNQQFLSDHSPLDPQSPSTMGRMHKRSYLSHLLRLGERYGETIACSQNLGVTLKLMRDIRTSLR